MLALGDKHSHLTSASTPRISKYEIHRIQVFQPFSLRLNGKNVRRSWRQTRNCSRSTSKSVLPCRSNRRDCKRSAAGLQDWRQGYRSPRFGAFSEGALCLVILTFLGFVLPSSRSVFFFLFFAAPSFFFETYRMFGRYSWLPRYAENETIQSLQYAVCKLVARPQLRKGSEVCCSKQRKVHNTSQLFQQKLLPGKPALFDVSSMWMHMVFILHLAPEMTY